MRICANKVVAGERGSTLLPNIRPQDTRQFASAQQIDQLEGLAVATPWFEFFLPHQRRSPKGRRRTNQQFVGPPGIACARRFRMDEKRVVNVLSSERDPLRHYVGLAANARSRLPAAHTPAVVE